MAMDALFDSAKQFAELLKQSRHPAVQDWKEEDLMRAFRWVDYFGKVQNSRYAIALIPMRR